MIELAIIDRLHRNNIREPFGCLVWAGSLFADGYGSISVDGQSARTHRISYELSRGPIPEGVFVCHRCDNRRCIEPSHLFLGTSQDNVSDMVTKGRNVAPKGTRHGRAKLTEEKVVAIRLDGRPVRVIAAESGVCERVIYDIRSRKTWRHVA